MSCSLKLKGESRIQFYVRSMGKLLQITAMFQDEESCNRYLAAHRNEGVIAQQDSFIFVADLHDKGLAIDRAEHGSAKKEGRAS